LFLKAYRVFSWAVCSSLFSVFMVYSSWAQPCTQLNASILERTSSSTDIRWSQIRFNSSEPCVVEPSWGWYLVRWGLANHFSNCTVFVRSIACGVPKESEIILSYHVGKRRGTPWHCPDFHVWHIMTVRNPQPQELTDSPPVKSIHPSAQVPFYSSMFYNCTSGLVRLTKPYLGLGIQRDAWLPNPFFQLDALSDMSICWNHFFEMIQNKEASSNDRNLKKLKSVPCNMSSAWLKPNCDDSINAATSFAPQSKTFPPRTPLTSSRHCSSCDISSTSASRADSSFRACSFSCCFCCLYTVIITHYYTTYKLSAPLWVDNFNAVWTSTSSLQWMILMCDAKLLVQGVADV